MDDESFVVLWWGDYGRGSTVWAPFPSDTVSFEWLAASQWMINYRVTDLHEMLTQLRASDIPTSDDKFEAANGIFGHSWDPEGNRIQLWQPHPEM